jgi:hypothetical protein
MGADYVVVDSSGALVSPSFPYSKFFGTSIIPLFPPPSGLAYLILTVKTGYGVDHPDYSAAVLINGTKIGTIDPRQWINHFVIDLETMIFVFDNTLLRGFLQTLQIVLQGNLADPQNFLLVGDAICHYRSS